MAENSKIEWTDHTFNPWIGCTKVSDGCKNCYAEALMDKRYGRVEWGPTGQRVRTSAANWKKPLAWNRKAEKAGKRALVLCASLADVFEDKPDQPELEEWRFDLLRLIVATPYLDWLLLTKRIEKVRGMVPWFKAPGTFGELPYAGGGFPENVWIGTSVENQEQANKRIPELLKIPAAVRFLSMEPLLGPVDLNNSIPGLSRSALQGANDNGTHAFTDYPDAPKVSWVIVGGESGSQARPMHPDWVRSLRDQCVGADTPFFFKQWGQFVPYGQEEIEPYSYYCQMDDKFHDRHGLNIVDRETCGFCEGWTGAMLDTVAFREVGKKAAGRLLDGQEWNQFPV